MNVLTLISDLDMLYTVASKTGDLRFSNIATAHAEKTLKYHIRYPEWSTCHVVNFDQTTGEPIGKFTHQGYKDESTWSRGQAWAIYGFATVYFWTKEPKYLDAAIKLGDHFMSRLTEDGVPYWYLFDFWKIHLEY